MSGPYWTARRLRDLDARLTERDRAVLGRVAALRFVSGGQLARLHFADTPERTAREALLRLTRLLLSSVCREPLAGCGLARPATSTGSAQPGSAW